MTHLGRDFSSFQGNLTDADCEGIDFAYVKATQGDTYKNPYAIQQCAMLRKHGVHVGYYHFLDPTVDTLAQLDNFARFTSGLGVSQLPLALDMEVASQKGWPALAQIAIDFAQGVEGWTNFVPNERSIFYVNISFYNALKGFPWGRWVWLADPNPGAPHRPCLILQGAPRPVGGGDGKVVDPDTFVGSEADWAAFTRSSVAPAPAPLPPNAVPGPNGLEVEVIGKMVNASGLFLGRAALGGITVYAGVGNPTAWITNFNVKTLPEGTPLAVALADAAKVATTAGYEQL